MIRTMSEIVRKQMMTVGLTGDRTGDRRQYFEQRRVKFLMVPNVVTWASDSAVVQRRGDAKRPGFQYGSRKSLRG